MRIAVLLVAVGPWSYTFCHAPPVYEEQAEWTRSRSFQTERAWADLETMAAIGPRPLGSEGVEQTRRYLRGELEALGLEVEEIDFAQVYEEEQAALAAAATEEASAGEGESVEEVFSDGAAEGADPAAGPSVEELGHLPRVLWAEIPGELSDVVLLGAAYATTPDEEGPAANGVASGPAVVLELARQVAAQPLDYTTWVAFLEASPGEQAVGTGRVWAQILEREGVLSRIRMAMIFRRVGGIDLQIERDLRSHRSSREAFWRAATRGGKAGIFRGDVPTEPSEAAHQALRDAGIKRVVAFVGELPEDAPADTLDQVSPESLGAVGQVALDGLGDITTRLAKVDRLLPPPEPEPVVVLEEGPESEVVEDAESAAAAGEEAATESAAPPDADTLPSDAEAPPSDAEVPPPPSSEGAASEPASP